MEENINIGNETESEIKRDDIKNKNNTKLSILIALLFIAITISAAIIYIYQIKIVKYGDNFLIRQNVSKEMIVEFLQKDKINLKENENNNIYKITELGIDIEINKKYNDCFKLNPYIDLNDIEIYYYNNELNKNIEKLNENRIHNSKPILYIENGKLILNEGKTGNYLDSDKLANDIMDYINSNIYEIKLENYYFTEKDIEEYTNKILNEKLKIDNFKISYTNGYTLSGLDLIDYIILKDDKVIFNEELEKECYKYIDKLLERNLLDYDTIGSVWDFTTTGNEQIKVSGGTYGDFFSSDKEAEYIIEKFKLFEGEENRTPIKTQDLADKIPDTYVEVSLSDQYMWYYKNGELILESDVVTGTKGKHDTPRGVYFVSEKKNGKYLTGADYRTWVNKWMRLTNRGHGLHDATWRSKFGEEIYTYDGSHGCVNLPKKIAYELYDLIELKDCVIIY